MWQAPSQAPQASQEEEWQEEEEIAFLFFPESDFRDLRDNTLMSISDYTVLDALQDILETDQAFFGVIRFLDGNARTHLTASHLRNTGTALGILRQYMANPQSATVVMNIPLRMDISGNSFFDSVPVYPSQEQIRTATETHVGVTNTNCTICQDSVTCATRIRHCGHCFHGSCLEQWFSMSPRCPVCRHDIRTDFRRTNSPLGNEQPSRSVYPDQE